MAVSVFEFIGSILTRSVHRVSMDEHRMGPLCRRTSPVTARKCCGPRLAAGFWAEHMEDGIEIRLSIQIAMSPTMQAHFRVVIEPEAALGLVEWIEAEVAEWEDRYGEIQIKGESA